MKLEQSVRCVYTLPRNPFTMSILIFVRTKRKSSGIDTDFTVHSLKSAIGVRTQSSFRVIPFECIYCTYAMQRQRLNRKISLHTSRWNRLEVLSVLLRFNDVTTALKIRRIRLFRKRKRLENEKNNE